MLVFGTKQETLPVHIERDATTGFPLLREQNEILKLILAYLALPYSVTEYGCGKKASLIIDYLLWLDIPAYATSRGMVVEKDMSPQALATEDYEQREHALIAVNPLSRTSDMSDPKLQRMIVDTCPGARVEKYIIRTGYSRTATSSFILRNTPHVQFVHARSHVFPILFFWDESAHKVEKRVVDPSINHLYLFPVEEIRDLLDAPESMIFEAPLLGSFRLMPEFLTVQQQEELSRAGVKDPDTLLHVSDKEHAQIVRALNHAEEDSIGDPLTWTYANNVTDSDEEHHEIQVYNTGKGNDIRPLVTALCLARQGMSGDAPGLLTKLRAIEETTDVHNIAKDDARWSERQLSPLADVTMTVVYYNTLVELARAIRANENPLQYLKSHDSLEMMRGIGIRLRRRIDWLADASKEPDGRIDARALTPGFIRAVKETIRQMNEAGLTVCIDKVGNCHGILLDSSTKEALAKGSLKLKGLLRNAIVMCSHIDTVNDAGRFDGRLGVAAGIETAHTIEDLYRYMNLETRTHAGPVVHNDGSGSSQINMAPVRLMVSAYIGEEMVFTGNGVSMPGSAAVCGQASIDDIYTMQNSEGENFKDKLITMLEELKSAKEEGLELLNDFEGQSGEKLLEACFEPADFYTPHSYERHIEQGPVLDRHQVPVVMVDTIMGIHQEDFFFESRYSDRQTAEAAALEFNRRLRDIALENQFDNLRITAGIIEGFGDYTSHEEATIAMRWTLEGETNHAGATPVFDRKDAGVAAGRLMRFFINKVHELDTRRRAVSGRGSTLTPLVGNIRLTPGVDRNVIPGHAAVSLAVTGDHLTVDEKEELIQTLQSYAIGNLQRRVESGGESLYYCRMDHMSYANTYSQARLTIDLRSDRAEKTRDYRNRIGAIIPEIEDEFQVNIHSEMQQRVEPSDLEKSGQCLLMERSYGGSHNPHEAELLNDLVRGSVLQFSVLRELMQGDGLPPGFNLFRFVEERIPKKWLRALKRFTSGALHDTCNIHAGKDSDD